MVAILSIVVFALKVLLILAITLIFAMGADIVAGVIRDGLKAKRMQTGRHTKISVADTRHKEELRRQKEADAIEGFFEESYAWVLNEAGAWEYKVHMIPTPIAIHFNRQMDRLVDDLIFQNTEEI